MRTNTPVRPIPALGGGEGGREGGREGVEGGREGKEGGKEWREGRGREGW